jgi:hypothetical protein
MAQNPRNGCGPALVATAIAFLFQLLLMVATLHVNAEVIFTLFLFALGALGISALCGVFVHTAARKSRRPYALAATVGLLTPILVLSAVTCIEIGSRNTADQKRRDDADRAAQDFYSQGFPKVAELQPDWASYGEPKYSLTLHSNRPLADIAADLGRAGWQHVELGERHWYVTKLASGQSALIDAYVEFSRVEVYYWRGSRDDLAARTVTAFSRELKESHFDAASHLMSNEGMKKVGGLSGLEKISSPLRNLRRSGDPNVDVQEIRAQSATTETRLQLETGTVLMRCFLSLNRNAWQVDGISFVFP